VQTIAENLLGCPAAWSSGINIEILDLEQVCLQIFFGKEHLVKNRLISTLDFKGTIFLWSTKSLFTSQTT
jgi:hypothetical protein